MEHAFAGLEAGSASKGFRYEWHLPERALLYQLVEQYYPELADLMVVQGKPLPGYVHQEFEEYFKCGRLEHGFLRLRCDSCHAEHLLAFSCKRRGFCPSCGARRKAAKETHWCGQQKLQQAFEELDPTTVDLPVQYCFIFDTHRAETIDVVPVIEHLQASRESHWMPNDAKNPQRVSRAKRIKEIAVQKP